MRAQLLRPISRRNRAPSHPLSPAKSFDNFRLVLIFALLGLAISLLAIGQAGLVGYDYMAEVLGRL